jgi:tetratricopeptide (TPR) repeat protein
MPVKLIYIHNDLDFSVVFGYTYTMAGFLKRFFLFLRKKKRPKTSDGAATEELWNADFSKPQQARFAIKSESSYDAYLHNRCLALGLKKAGCLAWTESPDYRYQDQVIKARFRLDSRGGYAAAGLIFRTVDEGTCYLLLVSGKSYFRLDVVRNNMPLPLIGWTEVPSPAPEAGTPQPAALPQGQSTDLMVIAYGSHLILIINGIWAAGISDSSLSSGSLGFAAASYEAGPGPADQYTAQAFLESFSVDSRIASVQEIYSFWNAQAVPAESRFRLAETFAAMEEPGPALIQLKKSWEERRAPEPDAPPEDRRTQRELLLAARLALGLELCAEAEEYANACIDQGRESPEGRAAITEKAKILSVEKRFSALHDYALDALRFQEDDPVLQTLLGHACWNLGEYEQAAAAYDRAFALDGENGIPAKNAANVYEVLGRRDEALNRYLAAGRAFLARENYQDLGLLAPKLLVLGADNWEAHALAGKWAYGIEDWAAAEAEFDQAEALRRARRPRPPKDPALCFLRGLLLIRQGKRREAFPLLEEAARFAPDYGLFQFRLAENRYLLSGNPADPRLSMDLEAALRLMPGNGWVHNFAAQIFLAQGNLERAAQHLEQAAAALGEVPAIRVNRAALACLHGSLEEALKILEAGKTEDPEGVLANCGGNFLVRAGDYERADEYYRKALALAPDNQEYLANRASCLIELGYYGQADELLALAHSRAPTPEILELISYVASKKGEFARAESAALAALEMDSGHIPSLLSLGWIYCSAGRWDEAGEVLRRLEALTPAGDAAERTAELRQRLEEGTTRRIACTACGRTWQVPRSPPPSPAIRLYAMPPDDFPAGTCPQCGRTYCIGCARERVDEQGRFLCPACEKSLKLIDEGLKDLVARWAAAQIPEGGKREKGGERGEG